MVTTGNPLRTLVIRWLFPGYLRQTIALQELDRLARDVNAHNVLLPSRDRTYPPLDTPDDLSEIRKVVWGAYDFLGGDIRVTPRELTATQIRTAVLKTIPNEYRERIPVIVQDGLYVACPRADLVRILNSDSWLARQQHLKDLFDCDDFARAFRVWVKLAFGVTAVATVYAVTHVFNVTVLSDQTVSWIEPQESRFVPWDYVGADHMMSARIEF